MPFLLKLAAVTHFFRQFGKCNPRKCWVAVCVALALAGCSKPIVKEGDAPAGPAYVKWMPGEYAESSDALKLPAVPEKWWQSFDSVELNGFVENAFKNNPRLSIRK